MVITISYIAGKRGTCAQMSITSQGLTQMTR